jgi:hypothetical protein
MPKETIKEHPASQAVVEVRWGEFQDCVELTVDRGQAFSFLAFDGSRFDIYTGLTVNFDTPEQIDELIKVLKRAKRKTFK